MPTPIKPSKYAQIDALRSDAVRFVNKAAEAAMREWVNADPANRGALGIKAMNFAYKKGGVGFFKIVPAIVDALVMPRGLDKTQTQILAEIQTDFPQSKLNMNLWNRPLSPSARTKAQSRIDGNMATPISIRDCKTLAEIRKKLMLKAQPKSRAYTFKPTITFTKDKLIVGKKVYSYSKGKPRYVLLPEGSPSTKRCRVNVVALLELFMSSGK